MHKIKTTENILLYSDWKGIDIDNKEWIWWNNCVILYKLSVIHIFIIIFDITLCLSKNYSNCTSIILNTRNYTMDIIIFCLHWAVRQMGCQILNSAFLQMCFPPILVWKCNMFHMFSSLLWVGNFLLHFICDFMFSCVISLKQNSHLIL